MSVTKSAGRRARGACGAVVTVLLAACAAGASSEELSGWWGWQTDIHDVIWLVCDVGGVEMEATELEAIDIPPFNSTEMQLTRQGTKWTLLGAKLELRSCPYPRGSLADALSALQYPISELQEITLWCPRPAQHTPRAEHFTGLNLRKLTIGFYFHDKPQLNSDMISPLAELTEFNIHGAILSPMPTTSRLRTVRLSYGRSTGAWGGCAELRELSVHDWEVPAAGVEDEGWLAHCPRLRTVKAVYLTTSSLVRVLRGSRSLTSLMIYPIEVLSSMQLDSLLSGLPLQQLDLRDDMFIRISENTLSTSLEKLTLSDARYSEGSDPDPGKQRMLRSLARLPALRDLTMNSYNDICELFSGNGSLPALPALRRLKLGMTSTMKLCFRGWESLEYMDLRTAKITKLQLMQLPPARVRPLQVYLHRSPYSPVREIPLDEAGYNLLRDRFNEGANVTIQGYILLNCDCEHAWVARALHTLPLSILGTRCTDYGNASLSDVPVERLECSRFECGQCTCRRAWRDNSTAATCGGSATRAPRALGMRALHAAGSHIDTLHADDLPDTLLTLDLTSSKISRLDESAVAALIGVSARVMWLAGNPLACDCAARPLLAALQRQRAQVRDFERVTCTDGRELHALDVDGLCSPPENPSRR